MPSDVIQAREAAGRAAGKAGEFSSALPTIGDVLRQKVTKAFNENKDIINQFGQSTTALANAPFESFGLFEGVENPFARERLQSQFVTTQALPAITQGMQLGQRIGSIADIVGQGTNLFQAQAQASLTAAEQARQRYQDLFNEFTTMQQLAAARQQAAAAAQASSPLDIISALLGGGEAGGGKPPNLDVTSAFKKIVQATGGNYNQIVKAINQLQGLNKKEKTNLLDRARLAYGPTKEGSKSSSFAPSTGVQASLLSPLKMLGQLGQGASSLWDKTLGSFF